MLQAGGPEHSLIITDGVGIDDGIEEDDWPDEEPEFAAPPQPSQPPTAAGGPSDQSKRPRGAVKPDVKGRVNKAESAPKGPAGKRPVVKKPRKCGEGETSSRAPRKPKGDGRGGLRNSGPRQHAARESLPAVCFDVHLRLALEHLPNLVEGGLFGTSPPGDVEFRQELIELGY
jgi:hypothetical protein